MSVCDFLWPCLALNRAAQIGADDKVMERFSSTCEARKAGYSSANSAGKARLISAKKDQGFISTPVL